MRQERRLGAALALASLTMLVSLAPLTVLFFGWAATIWIAAAVVAAAAGLSSAHLLFVARQGDRTCAQTLCAWVGGAALLLALLAVMTAIACALVVVFLMLRGPWCGVCGT